MSWRSDFKQALQAPSITPKYILEIVSSPINGTTTIYTDSGTLQIVEANIDGTSVTPQRWSVSFGGFSVTLAGDIRNYTKFLRRGCIAILYVHLVGLSDPERLGIGQLDTMRGQRGLYQLRFKDILSAFQSRISKTYSGGVSQSQFFYGTNYTTTVSSNYTAGGTSLQVASTANFDKSSGHNGLLYCQPTGGDPFYMQWSSKTSTVFTVTGSASHPSENPIVDLTTGDLITNAARIAGAPWSFFGQIVTSTGSGNNGALDLLPASYGTNFPLPYDFFDIADAQSTTDYIVRSGGLTYAVDFATFQPFESGLRSIMDIFAEVGQWPSMRQNSFTWRGCFDPTGLYGYKPALSDHITDKDIIRIASVDFFDPSLKAAYIASNMQYTISGLKGAKNNPLANSLPLAGIKERDFSRYYDPNFSAADMAREDLNRMAIWDYHHWTKISLQVSLKFAVLCAGDLIEISSRYIVDSYTPTGQYFVRRPAMVLEVGYNLNDRTCDIVLGVPPQF